MSKRLFDFFISLAGLVFFLPVMIILILLVKITSKGHAFYQQERIGLEGRTFRLLKLRTMFEDINKTGSCVTVKNDPRITPMGKLLRKLKLDELPQLINVLKGDMSFVGPRPDVTGFADKLQGEDRIILTVRPGITGPATLKYRNEEEILAAQVDPEKYNAEVIYPDKIKLNREYAKNHNFFTDLVYIIKTIFPERKK